MIRQAHIREQKGQNLVELALILPVLLLLTLGVLDLGRSYYYYVSITNAAREGARFAALHPSGSVSSHVIQELSPDIVIEPADVGVSTSATPGRPREVRVTVTYRFDLVAGGVWSWLTGITNPVVVNSSASMPVTSSF